MKDNNLKKSIKNAMNKSNDAPRFDSQKGFQKDSLDHSRQEEDIKPVEEKMDLENVDKDIIKKTYKPLKIFGGFCIAAFAAMLMFSNTPKVDKSNAAKDALKNKVSTSLSVGTILLSSDENIGQQDYTITHNWEGQENKIWIWDYAAEDGDYVQVLINGSPYSEPFMIKHKPKEFIVPAVGDIQVKGIKDGGGGITYAVRYELNGTNYFNSAPEGEFNTYTLVKE